MNDTWTDLKNGTTIGKLPQNGLNIVMKKTSKEPNAIVLLHFSIGSNSEIGANERGMAHMMEHSWFKGSKAGAPIHLSEVDIPEIARALGAEFNAYTSTNKTCYYFKTAPELIHPFISIMGTLMQHASLKDEHMKSEKLAVLQEMARGKDNIVRDALIEIRKAMYSGETKQDNKEFPQFYPTIGNIEDIANSTADMMQAFYHRLYRAENATLFVVGDIDEESMKKHIVNEFSFVSPTSENGHDDDSSKTVPEHLLSIQPISIEKPFSTLEPKQSLIVLGYRTGHSGLQFDVVSKTMKTLLMNGSKSRLHKEIVANEDLHIHSVGGFSVQDRHYGEFYLFFDGTDKALESVNTITSKVKAALKDKMTDNEWKVASAATDFDIAGRETDIESYTKAWSDDYQITRDASNFEKYQQFVIHNDTRSMIDEQLAAFAAQTPFVVSYRACTQEEAPKLSEERVASNRYFTNVLTNDDHKRTAPIEEPHSLSLFTTPKYTQVRPSVQTIDAIRSGSTVKVVNPDFEFYRHISVPCYLAQMQQSGNIYELGLLNDIVSETIPQITFMKNKLKCSLSPTGASVSSINTNKFMNEWRKRFANGFTKTDMKKIQVHYEVHKDRFKKKWKSDNDASKMDPMSRLFDVAQAYCSDNFVPKRHGLETKYDFHQAEIKRFNVMRALQKWNKYYKYTNSLYVSKIASKKASEPFDQTIISNDLEATTFEQLTEPKRIEIQINPKVALNQSIVALVRPGSLTKQDADYHTLRPMAQNLLFRSIGSRLFKIRESTGLFYTASGAFSVGATHTHKGFDFVLCKVNPQHVDKALAELRAFVAEGFETPVSGHEFRAAQRIYTEQWRSRNTENSVGSTWSQHFQVVEGNPFDVPQKRIDEAYGIRSEQLSEFLNQTSKQPFMLEIVCI